MNNFQKKSIYSLFLGVFFILTLNSCVKKTTPILDTLSYSAITDSSVTLTINVNEDGNEDIPLRGFCYGTKPNPTILDNIKNISGTLGSMQGQLTDLISTTTYYVRAYASNSEGTTYSNEVTFTTRLTTKHLMAYYPFSGNAIDASGKGNHGSIHGSLIPTIDRKGNANSAYEFDGNSSYIEIPSNYLLKPTTKITLSAWVCPYTNKDNDDIIVLSYNGTYYPYTSYGIGKLINKKITFLCTTGTYSYDAESTTIEGTTILLPNTWYMVTATYDGSMMKLYINGVLENSTALTGALVYNENPLKLGHSVNTQFFQGKLDEIRIYNKALNQAEITQLYNEY